VGNNYIVYDSLIEKTNSTWGSWVTEAEDHQDISDRFEAHLKSEVKKLSGHGTYRTATTEAIEALRGTFPKHSIPQSFPPTPIIPFFKNLSSRKNGEQVNEFWVLVSKHRTQGRGKFIWGFLSHYTADYRILSVRGGIFVWKKETEDVIEASIDQNEILRALKDRMDKTREELGKENPEYSLSDRAWQDEPEDFWTDLATMMAELEDMKWVLYAIPLSVEDMDAVPSDGIINWLGL
jgi:hypothetical protein